MNMKRVFFVIIFLTLLLTGSAQAAQLSLGWQDNSNNEDGFSVERGASTSGPFTALSTVGPNVTSYTDGNLTVGQTYCYRVNAGNAAGVSAYTGIACGIAMATPPPPPPPLDCAQIGVGVFTGCYYDNKDFTSLVLIRTDPAINFDWGTGSPAPSIGPDTFSVKWAGDFNFATAGTYRFTATTGDGMRVFVDGKSIIDKWVDQSTTAYTADLILTAGSHRVTVDYYENIGSAVAKLSWVMVGGAPPPPPPPATFVLTVTKTGTGGGSVSGTGITCGADCTETLPAGAKVTLAATPATGSTFGGWSASCPGGVATMNVAVNCIAMFTANVVIPPPAGLNCSFAVPTKAGTVSMVCK